MRSATASLLLLLSVSCDQSDQPCLRVARCFEHSSPQSYRDCVGNGLDLPEDSPVVGLASLSSKVCRDSEDVGSTPVLQQECLEATWQVRSEMLSCVLEET